MSETPASPISRRAVLAVALAALPGAAAAAPKIVTLLGDSITAGYGLPAAQALPAQVQAALARMGTQAVVRGAGVSGDTSAGGLARVDFSVRSDTDVCLVALGGNDLMMGLEPARTQDNLDRIVARLQARRIGVVLAGLSAPTVVGRSYARDFDAVFPAVARRRRTLLYPDLLAGVARDPRLNQPDGIHPNPTGVRIIAGRLAPLIIRALAARR